MPGMQSSGGPAPDPSYENVEPLLDRSKVNGALMEYVFRCPVTGAEVTGCAPIPDMSAPENSATAWWTPRGMASGEGTFLARTAADNVVGGAYSVLEAADGLLGLGRARRSVKKVRAESVENAALAQGEWPRRMLVTAFLSVAHEFTWDGGGGRWVKASV